MSEDLMRSGNPFDIIFVIRNLRAISYIFLNCLSLSSVLAKIDALPAYFIFYPLLRAVEYYQLSWQRKLTSIKRSVKSDVSSVIPSSVLCQGANAETSKTSKRQLWNSLHWPIYVINTVDDTKLPSYTLPPIQHHSFFRKLSPLVVLSSVCFP